VQCEIHILKFIFQVVHESFTEQVEAITFSVKVFEIFATAS
jgi:hypothetical protein